MTETDGVLRRVAGSTPWVRNEFAIQSVEIIAHRRNPYRIHFRIEERGRFSGGAEFVKVAPDR